MVSMKSKTYDAIVIGGGPAGSGAAARGQDDLELGRLLLGHANPTDHASEVLRGERFLAAGMDAYISKPLKPVELTAAINQVMQAMETC